jgi:hypothetical protein
MVHVVRMIHVAVQIDLVMAHLQAEPSGFTHAACSQHSLATLYRFAIGSSLRREERDDLGAARRHDDLLLDPGVDPIGRRAVRLHRDIMPASSSIGSSKEFRRLMIGLSWSPSPIP